MPKFLILLFLALAAYGQQIKTSVAVLPSDGTALNIDELETLTDEMREAALKVLPTKAFVLLPQNQVFKRLGGIENFIKECKESTCIVDLGKKAQVDYIAKASVLKFGNSIRLKVELYDVYTEGLVGMFNDEAPDIKGLLAIVKNRASGEFSKIPGAYKSSKAASRSVDGGIKDVQTTGSGFVFEGGKNYLVHLNSEPTGAALSFNGVASTKCPTTPCNLILGEGDVRIIAALEQYDNSDTTVSITSNNQNIDMKLKPNFGYLEIKPALLDELGDYVEWELKINGKGYNSFDNRLSPGNYNVKLNHRCYEAISFTASIKKGKHEVFDMASHLTLKKGGLSLDAERDGEPVSEPVFVNGKQVGETPFNDAVPLCSEIEIGKNRERVYVYLKYNENVSYTHKGNLYEFYKSTNKNKEPSFSTPKFETSGNTTFWIAIGLDVLGVAMLYVGHKKQDEMWVEYDKYGALGPANNYGDAWENVESLRSSRNTFYILGSLILASGIGIHIWF